MVWVRAAWGSMVALATILPALGVLQAEERTAWAAAFDSITTAELKTHVDVLADDTFEGREAGSRGGRAAGNYLAKFLDQYKIQPAGDGGTYFQSFRGSYRNVLGWLAGSDPELKHELIIVSGHYDHVGYGRASNSYGPTGYIHNGADDNASGTAGVLEIVEAFSKLPAAPSRSILFAFWDGEENGLLGSEHWVTHPTLAKHKVTMMLNVDMIGRLRKGRVEVYGTRTSHGLRKLLARGNQTSGLDLDFIWDMKADSDHHSFFARGIPTLMLHTGLHDDYHRPSDDAHKVNVEGIRQVSQLLFAISNELADQPRGTTFRAGARRESSGNKPLLEAPLPSAPPRLGLTWTTFDPSKPGLAVATISSGSAAEKAGLRLGDRILELGGKPIVDDKQFVSDVLAAKSPVEAVVARAGQTEPLKLSVALAGQPIRVGIGWREDDAEPGAVLLTQVMTGSPAQRAGLVLRDRIYEIAGEEFANGEELRQQLAKRHGAVELLVERRGKLQKVVLDLPPLAE